MVSGFFCTRPLMAAMASGQVREQKRLAIGRCETDHFVNGIAEAHIQHPSASSITSVCSASSETVPFAGDPAGGRRRDNNVRRMLKRITLGAERLSAAEG
jgi:hypothetical protein